MAYVPFEEFGIMRNLRTVGIAKTRGKIMNMQGMALLINAIMRKSGMTLLNNMNDILTTIYILYLN